MHVGLSIGRARGAGFAEVEPPTGRWPPRRRGRLAVTADSHLGGLSALAARGFASSAEATDAILRLAADQLGMRSALLIRIARDTGQSDVLAAYNAPGGSGVPPGTVLALQDTY